MTWKQNHLRDMIFLNHGYSGSIFLYCGYVGVFYIIYIFMVMWEYFFFIVDRNKSKMAY